MVLTLDFLAEDLAQTRLACSPLWETIESLRMRQDPAAFAVHEEWVRVSEERLRGFDFGELLELVPPVGYIPDFLTPPPQAPLPSIADELAELEATPAAQVRADLADRFGPEAAAPEHVRRWLARPAEARDHIVGLLREYWERAVAPDWPRIRALHEAELESRARQQARKGTGQLLGDLHPAIAWRAGTLRVRGRRAGRVALGGRGLVVISSVFVWPLACSMVAPPWQPALVYPPRGVGGLWAPEPRDGAVALEALLGRTRAAVLRRLAAPCTTTDLARDLDLTAGAVSLHLTVMHQAGLLVRRRAGRSVLYGLGAVGEALLSSARAAPAPPEG
jgi:DNA-binding transcriptional ArsR family regulator